MPLLNVPILPQCILLILPFFLPVAAMFLLVGLLVIVVQSSLLKFFNDLLGERRVVMLAFLFGVAHNLFYGLAQDKTAIFVGAALSSLVSMSFPTISAIKSNNVSRRKDSSPL